MDTTPGQQYFRTINRKKDTIDTIVMLEYQNLKCHSFSMLNYSDPHWAMVKCGQKNLVDFSIPTSSSCVPSIYFLASVD